MLHTQAVLTIVEGIKPAVSIIYIFCDMRFVDMRYRCYLNSPHLEKCRLII